MTVEQRSLSSDEQQRIAQIAERATPHMGVDSSGFAGVVSFLSYFESLSGQKQVFFEPLLVGRPLTDLGCGTSITMAKFAYGCGVTEYVGVDKYNRYNTREEPELAARIREENRERGSDFNIRYVAGDMLVYLASLPSDSTNLTLNGIDLNTVSEYPAVYADEYKDELVRQIERVVPEGGVVFGIDSDFFGRLIKSNNFALRRDDILGVPSPYGQGRRIICWMFQKKVASLE